MRAFHASSNYEKAKSCLEVLLDAGFESYFAGGCVRDALLGRVPNDFDIATRATPEKVMQLFEKSHGIGSAFGVVLVIHEGQPFEVATFRGDGAYRDGRRPSEVTFTGPAEDAIRRDFTVNGLFYDVRDGKVIDFVDGLNDLDSKTLRAIGDPLQRFNEDHLRVLRALRFSIQLGFELEELTAEAIRSLAYKSQHVSKERIYTEIEKILKIEKNSEAFLVMQGLEIAKAIFKPWYSHEGFERSAKLFKVVSQVLRDPSLLWASLFFGSQVTDVEAEAWMSKSRFPKKEMQEIKSVLQVADEAIGLKPKDLSAFLVLMDRIHTVEVWPFMVECFEFLGKESRQVRLAWSEYLKRVDRKTGRLPRPILNGRDLIDAGLEPGPKFSQLLDSAYQYQIWQEEQKKAALLRALLKGKIIKLS